MRSILFSLLITSISFSIYSQDSWPGVRECGLYRARGVVHSTKDGLLIVINEKTKSEFTITVPILNEAMLAPYIDKPIEAMILFENISKKEIPVGLVKDIKSRLPNPLNPKDTGISISTKVKCK